MNMASINLFLVGFLLISCVLALVGGEIIQGATPLNAGTFDKLIDKFEATLVKFDEMYPYGDKQDAFKTVAKATMSQPDLMVGEVGIADWGEKENADLGDRFGVSKDNYPVYKLFRRGESEPATFTGDFKDSEDIIRFIVKESDLWLGLPACIEAFDKLVEEFFSAEDKQSVIARAEKEAEGYTEDEVLSTRAMVYVKAMQKITEKGNGFVNSEIERVEKLSQGKVSDKKKAQLKDRASILTSFQRRLKIQSKEEL